MEPIKVLVVDDSSLMRKLISHMIESDKDLVVSDTAINGVFALQKLEKNPPDVVLLDIEMPDMNGIDFLIKRNELGIDIPVIVLSSLGRNRPELTFQTLELGAKDFVLKPAGSISMNIEEVKDEVIPKIKYFVQEHRKLKKDPNAPKTPMPKIEPKGESTPSRPQERQQKDFYTEKIKLKTFSNIDAKLKNAGKIQIVGIGISTGGPNALRNILPMIPGDFPAPMLIVQHMPAGFTFEFAKGLNDICNLPVKEAEDGELINKGSIYVAPGDYHVTIGNSAEGQIIKLNQEPLVSGHRPSCDVLFHSINKVYGRQSICCIMTGMGKDGADGIKSLWQNGGITVAQDEDSCVVFGMPKVAIQNESVDIVLTLDDIPKYLYEWVMKAQ